MTTTGAAGLVRAAADPGRARARTEDFTRLPTPAEGGRASAVLVLLGEQPAAASPDVLVLQRAATLRNHAGQPAFPGGAADPDDADPAATALREAHEEVGLDPASVTVLAQLPTLWIPVSDFVVTPVLAWWHAPHPVQPHEPAEVAHVARLPVAELVDPANRLRVRHPSGWIGPAFQVRGHAGLGLHRRRAVHAAGAWAAGRVPWPHRPDRRVPPPDARPVAGTDQPTSRRERRRRWGRPPVR